MVRISKKEIDKLLKIKSDPSFVEKKNKSPADRLQSVLLFNQDNSNDSSFVDHDQLVIELKDMRLLSNNDLLRIDNRKLTPYKNQCKNRIKNAIKSLDIKSWKEYTKDKQIKIEYIYAPSHGKKMDTMDGIPGAFKYLIDGLTINKLIIDDSDKYVPIAISKQFKGNNEIYILLTIIDDVENYYSPQFKKIISGC